MQIIRLRVHESVYKPLMWFLRKFGKEELEIIEEDQSFVSAQQELKQDLEKLEKGEAEFVDLQQLDDTLESTIRRYEA